MNPRFLESRPVFVGLPETRTPVSEDTSTLAVLEEGPSVMLKVLYGRRTGWTGR